jgi:type II secretory pathway pseudopilin PulG
MKNLSPRRSAAGFTLVEMLTVVLIIIILSGLVISTARFVQQKGAMSRAQGEIQAMETALERYKNDNGEYPPYYGTDTVEGAKVLYQALTGDGNDLLVSSGGVPSSGMENWGKQGTTYMDTLKPNVHFYQSGNSAYAVMDPWGKPYRYRTVNPDDPSSKEAVRNDATFDLWSTAGRSDSDADEPTWVKNWE